MIFEPKWKSLLANTVGPIFTPQQCQDIIKNPDTDFARFGLRKTGKDGKPYPTATTRDICTKHYMYSKEREFKSDDSLAVSVGKLQTTLAQMKNKVEARFLTHLSRWVAVLKKP